MKFKIKIIRTVNQFATVTIEAANESEAIDKAECGEGIDWDEVDDENGSISVQEITQLDRPSTEINQEVLASFAEDVAAGRMTELEAIRIASQPRS